jgi:hypothetical protein
MKAIFTLLVLLATMAVSAKDFLDMKPEERDALPVVKSNTFDHPDNPEVKDPETLKQAKEQCQERVKNRREVSRIAGRLRKYLVEEAYVHFCRPKDAADSNLRKKCIDRGYRCFNMYPRLCDSHYLEACLGATILDILAVGAPSPVSLASGTPKEGSPESQRDSFLNPPPAGR